MITTRLYRKGAQAEEGFDPARVSDLLEERGTLVWLDLDDPSEPELAMIEEEFSIHPLAMEDARHRNQRPKIEPYEGFDFLVFYGVSADDGKLDEHEIQVFVGQQFLVTLRFKPALDLHACVTTAERHPDLVKEGGGFLLYALLDEIVDGYFHVTDRLEDETEDLVEEVFQDEAPEDVQERVFLMRKRTMSLRRRVSPLRDVLDLLQGQPHLATPALAAYYRDVYDHVIRVVEFVDTLREVLTSVLDTHLVRISNRLNEVMKQLTSWAAIILVPTLIAGIYGMNFTRGVPPEWDSPFGFWIALGLMVLSGGLLYAFFKRRGWL